MNAATLKRLLTLRVLAPRDRRAVLLGLGLAAYDVWDQLFRRGAPGN